MQTIIKQLLDKEGKIGDFEKKPDKLINELKRLRKAMWHIIPEEKAHLIDEYCDATEEYVIESKISAYKKGIADGINFILSNIKIESTPEP